MARIFPDSPPRFATSEVIRVFNSLKRLPNDYAVWHNMDLHKQKAPDFLLVHEDGRVILIMVSPATSRDAKFAGQLTLLETDQTPLGQVEENILASFVASLGIKGSENIQTLVVFPNIPHEQLQQNLKSIPTQSYRAHWIGREVTQQEAGIQVQENQYVKSRMR